MRCRRPEARIYFLTEPYGDSLSPGHWAEDGITSNESEREVARPFERCRRVQLVRQYESRSTPQPDRPWTTPIITGPTARDKPGSGQISERVARTSPGQIIPSESSKRGKRIRLFGNIAKSAVCAVAIECRHKVLSGYESKRSNHYSTRALAVVLRLARFRGV